MPSRVPSSGAHNYRGLNNGIRNYSAITAIIANPRDHKLLSKLFLLFNAFLYF
jgi:hypothetical protein